MIYDFVSAALPWVAIGIGIACYVAFQAKKEPGEKKDP